VRLCAQLLFTVDDGVRIGGGLGDWPCPAGLPPASAEDGRIPSVSAHSKSFHGSTVRICLCPKDAKARISENVSLPRHSFCLIFFPILCFSLFVGACFFFLRPVYLVPAHFFGYLCLTSEDTQFSFKRKVMTQFSSKKKSDDTQSKSSLGYRCTTKLLFQTQ